MLRRMNGSMIAKIMIALVLCMASPFASAGSAEPVPPVPPAGLMWNKTGLPAVFPLQVKTVPGQDYLLSLIDLQSGDPVLAAYVTGGAFFRVLVPPGVFRLRFATGKVWQGEDALFGPGAQTQVFELPEPLTFETRGLGGKAGHIVNLLSYQPGQRAEIMLNDQLICQSFRPGFFEPIHEVSERTWNRERQDHTGILPPGAGEPDLEQVLSGKPRDVTEFERAFRIPRYDVWSRFCE